MKRSKPAKKSATRKAAPKKSRAARVLPVRDDEEKPELAAAEPAVEPTGRILERPGGFYWQEKDGGEEYGPFATRAEAEADMQSDGGVEPEAVQEAESELGINEWIDPDTGVPAEEHGPRLEDH